MPTLPRPRDSVAVAQARRDTWRRHWLPGSIRLAGTEPIAIPAIVKTLPIVQLASFDDVHPEPVIPVRRNMRRRRITRMAFLGRRRARCRRRLDRWRRNDRSTRFGGARYRLRRGRLRARLVRGPRASAEQHAQPYQHGVLPGSPERAASKGWLRSHLSLLGVRECRHDR